jgi:coatomer protein complex subunit gamma
VSPVSLERALLQYSQNVSEKPFDIKVVPTIDVSEHVTKTTSAETAMPKSVKPTEKPTASRQDIYAEQLGAIPEFAHLGPLFKSSSSVELTETETEYNIKCVKHTFTNYIVFQVYNTQFILVKLEKILNLINNCEIFVLKSLIV